MRAIVLLVLVTVAAIACRQGVGDRCQLRSDCADGLRCVLSGDRMCAIGGSCQPEGAARPCATSADCVNGYACAPPGDCTEQGHKVCAPGDMAAPTDSAVEDAAIGDGTD